MSVRRPLTECRVRKALYLFSVTARGTPRHAAAPERGSMSRSNVRKPRSPDNSEASGAATLLRVTDPRSGAVALTRLAGAFPRDSTHWKSGSKLRALQTLRE